MNTRALLAAATASGAAGVVLLAVDLAPIIAGVLVGAAAVGIPAVVLLHRVLAQLADRTADFRARAADLDARRDQYDAAYATLAGQRERLRAGLQAHLAQQQAEMAAAHRRDLLAARAEAYLEGIKQALAGPDTSRPAEGRVIDLADRRSGPALVDQT